ncbi:MAG TPA: hypothetical protein VFP84_30785 [Kofleriaceae bacterium]|nr:hypothetical protein [Kofleriaceae bacterium]
MVLDPSTMGWATKVAPYVGNKDADDAYAFARQVNKIPAGTGIWSPSSADLGRTYRDVWLNNADVPRVNLTAQQQAEYTAAQAYIDNEDKSMAYSSARQNWEFANTNYLLASFMPRNDPSYFATVLQARRDAANALIAWQTQGHKAEYEHNFAIVQHYGELGLLNAIQNLKNDYDNTLTANATSTGTHFAPVQLYPNNFLAANGPAWNKFHISTAELAQFASSSGYKYSSGTDVGFLFWSIAQGGNSGWTQRHWYQMSTSQLDVSFDFLRVRLDRSDWFDSFLLTSNAWFWAGSTVSHPNSLGITFSNGAPPPNTAGSWQMIPTEMIVTRNLRVNAGSFDLKHSDFATQSSSSSSSGFLFWSTSSHSSSSASSNFNASFTSNSEMFAPQPQIVAFVCQLMPREPNPAFGVLPR